MKSQPATRSTAFTVQQKIVPPGFPATAIARPRLDLLYARLLEEHEALAVFATAGSGKTIQAQMFAACEQLPLAWLTLDGADRSPSRLLSYLARALRSHVADAEAILESAFATEPVPEVAAALLAESIQLPRLLIVFDQCEAIADSSGSCSVVQAFLDYLPGGARVLVQSRQEMKFSLGRLLLNGRVGRITDEDLAVTRDEAEALMRVRGDDGDVDVCLERTSGWIAAVAFGSSRTHGGHDIARDFSSYVAAEIFDVLDAGEQRFLLDTSILDAVSIRGAVCLCGNEGRVMLNKVKARHLPATTSMDGTIVYHPCFRRFLRERLESDDASRLDHLRSAYADLLFESEQYEDAAELLLDLGRLDDSLRAVERACGSLVDRCDWETVLRWGELLGPDRVNRIPVFLGATIAALRGARRLDEARALIRELDACGLLAEVVASDERVVINAAWSMLWQPREGLQLLNCYDIDRRAAGARYMLEVTSGEEPVEPPRGLKWMETDRLVSWALMVQGRLAELVAMLPAEDQWPPRTPYTTPHPLLGLIWRGELGRARELFDQVPEGVRLRIHTDLWYYLESWLLLAEEDFEGALVASQRAVMYSRRTRFGFEPVFQIVEGEALISLGRIEDAIRILGESIGSSRSSGLRAYDEWGQTVLGHALLLRSDNEIDNEKAAKLLRVCIASMSRARRLLLLPAAATYLAEAEWRLGHADAALSAADLAYESSVRMGAFSIFKRALGHFPAVLTRLLQHSPDATKWRRVTARPTITVSSRNWNSEGAVFALIQPFGASPDIVVNGHPAGIRRLKMVELASYLASWPSGVGRDDILLNLFPESDRSHASNHFRQVVHQMRKTTGLSLQRLARSRVAWSETVVVDTVDRRFELALNEANMQVGELRLDRMVEALDLVVGPYLASSELQWVTDRRFQLEILQEEAELETARLALELQDFESARRFGEEVLARNPYSEPAYQVMIGIDLAVGTETAALATYRRAVSALRDIGLEPGRLTLQLVKESAGGDRDALPMASISRADAI